MESQQTDRDRVDIERVMGEEKVIVTLEALKERIKQHQAGFRLASTRIEACNALLLRSPAEERYLRPTIDIWTRLRAYHGRVLEESRQLEKDLPRPPGSPA